MKKITLLFALAAFILTSTISAQNYGLKTTGEAGSGFSSDQIGGLLSNQTAFTIEFWYQIETFAANTWIFKVEGSANNRIGLLTPGADNGGVYVRIGDGTNHGQQPFWNTDLKVDNGWNHVALTYDAGAVKLYINGLERNGGGITGAYPTNIADLSAAQFQIGWTTGANIDELRITKGTALSAIDIAKSSNPTSFDAYFDFNGNERPTGADGTNTAIPNTGSDATVLGQINNFATTYEVLDNATLSVKGRDQVSGLQIYPNPASDHVNIQLPAHTSAKVSVYNITGKLLIQHAIAGQNEVRIDTNTLAKGMYMLSFENDATKIVNKLIVR